MKMKDFAHLHVNVEIVSIDTTLLKYKINPLVRYRSIHS